MEIRLVETVKGDRYLSCDLNPKEASTTKPKYYPGENRFSLLLEHVRSTLIGKLNTPKIVNHNANLDTVWTPNISLPQPITYSSSQSPSPSPHFSRTILAAFLPSTIDVVKSDISASTSSKNSNTPLTTSLSLTELTVDGLTVKPTINDLVPTIIPSSTSRTPHRAISTTYTPKTKMTRVKKPERKINSRTKPNSETETELQNRKGNLMMSWVKRKLTSEKEAYYFNTIKQVKMDK